MADLTFCPMYLGRVPYERALGYQYECKEHLKKALAQDSGSAPQFLLGLEHPSVITLGRRARREQEVFCKDQTPVVTVERGGLATLHNPGQLVIYPIVSLRELNLGVRQWVKVLLETTSELLGQFGIEASSLENPAGVYTPSGKIAFVGVQIQGGISLHGLSLNVSNRLQEFHKIQGCGVANLNLDSMAQNLPGRTIDLSELFHRWAVIFIKNIGAIKAPLHTGLMGQGDGPVHTGG